MIFACFAFAFLSFKCCFCWQDSRPTLRIGQGLIEGTIVYRESSKSVYSYLGIPYASPPINNLRFAPPEKHSGWNGTYQAFNYGPKCPQLPFQAGLTDNEDCLNLNIWTPVRSSNSPLLPVMLFFEGFYFETSSDLTFSGQDFALEGIIVVSINYRLNIFGFFCLGSSEARGNLGLLDQYFSLVWVRENIRHFGGDPDKVTLFGYGSGAASVTLHLISPRTAGMFQRAIISSGSAVTPWLTLNDPTLASREVLNLLGCSSQYVLNAMDCIRSKKVEHILQALDEYSGSYNWSDKFTPIVDTFLPGNNRYLPVEATKALRDGTYLQVPILTGITKPIANPQFSKWLELASQGYTQLQQYTERAKIPEIMRLYRFNGNIKDQLYELIKWRYASFIESDVRLLYEQLKKLEFESKIEATHFMQLSSFVSSYVQPIYVYFMDDIGFVLNTTDSLASTDILLLFGPVLFNQAGRRRFNPVEARLSNLLKYMWINFINFGNPTPNDNKNISWRKYSAEDPYIEHFETVKAVDLNAEVKKRIEGINFWNTLLPKINSMKNRLPNSLPKELQNSPDPAAGFRNAMYTLLGLVMALLILLTICLFLLKRRAKEGPSRFHMGY